MHIDSSSLFPSSSLPPTLYTFSPFLFSSTFCSILSPVFMAGGELVVMVHLSPHPSGCIQLLMNKAKYSILDLDFLASYDKGLWTYYSMEEKSAHTRSSQRFISCFFSMVQFHQRDLHSQAAELHSPPPSFVLSTTIEKKVRFRKKVSQKRVV